MTVEGGPTADPARRIPTATHTRGFLFADIRGYTEYIERYGANAAADLLARYRAIVRTAIAGHDGAEIRTEGDSFYVVLPSASSAVLCALSILEELAAENTRQPDHRIGAGIGVHAGEAIDTAEGLVGSAVNMAARLSALARPGEVLVSETVRALTRSVIPVSYLARGRHRLKGVADQQEVFAAVPSAAPTVAVRSRRVTGPLSASAGVIALVAIIALVYISLPAGAGPGVSATPSALAVASTQPFAPTPTVSLATPSVAAPTVSASAGPTVIYIDPDANSVHGGLPLLGAGTYRWDTFRPILVFRVDHGWTDRDWYAAIPGSDFAELILVSRGVDAYHESSGSITQGMMLLAFARVQTVVGNLCDPGDTSSYELLGGRPRDMIDWLSNHRFLAVSNRQPIELAGWSGLSADVTVKGDPGMECSGSAIPHQGSVYVFKTTPAGDYNGLYRIEDGDQARFIVLDIGDDTPLVLVAISRAPDFPGRMPWAQDIIDTITVINE